jgi:hypothetical protein
MTLVVVRDRQEIYDTLSLARRALPQRPAPRISVRAPGLDEQIQHDLESEIQAILDRTLQQARSAQPAAAIEPPSDEQVREMIRAQHARLLSPASPAPGPRPRPPGNRGIRVATNGLELGQEDRRAFNSEVRQLVRERLGGTSPDVVICPCGGIFGGCCWPPSGTEGDVTVAEPFLPPTVNNPISIAVYFGGGSDVLLWQIWATPQPLPRTRILVGLRIDTTLEIGQWAKEITGWTTCECTVQTDHVESPANDYSWMLIDRASVDTLGFRKAVLFGWSDVGFFGPSPQIFWDLLGGFILTFDWLFDFKVLGSEVFGVFPGQADGVDFFGLWLIIVNSLN